MEAMNAKRNRGRKLVDYHIPSYMGFKSQEWKMFKDRGIAPASDGVKVNPSNGRREPFWYESTLIGWKEPRPKGGNRK